MVNKEKLYFSQMFTQRRKECGFKSQGAFKKAFDEERKRITGIEKKIDKNSVSDWSTGNSKPSAENLKIICSILKVNEDYFEYKVDKERYKLDSLFIDEIGVELYEHVKEIGLNPAFIHVIRELVDFDSEFPCWSSIGYAKKQDISDYFIHNRPLYARKENWAESAPASDNDVKKLQIRRNGKLITLNLNDFDYLLDVQKSVQEYIGYLFYKRAKEMEEEVKEANRLVKSKNRMDGPLTVQELNRIDRYGKYE